MISTSKTQRCKPEDISGFTLVETAISIGIIAFAMMGVLGLIPVGLSNFQSAQQLTIESALIQGITGELQRTDGTNLRSRQIYFDDQGRETVESEATYTVNIDTPRDLESGGLLSPSAARSVLLTVTNRTRPTAARCYSVILPGGQ